MNIQETLALLDALKSGGATHFKSQDFEVTFGKNSSDPGAARSPSPQASGAGPSSNPGPADSPENKEATEKIKGLIATMKLDDDSLLDKIFPAGAGG